MNNIIKRFWNQNSMVIIEDLQGMAFQAESGGHTFQISGIDGEGNAVALSGTPAGVMLRTDGQDVALTCSVSGGVVSATLPANAYSVPGRFGLTIFLTSDRQKTAIYAAVGTVSKTSSGTVAPPAGSDVVDLVNAIATAVATIPASYTDLMASVAPTYSSSGLYAVGSYAWYNGKLYRCTTPITSGETWTSGHWTLANLGSDLVDLKSATTKLVSYRFNYDESALKYGYSEFFTDDWEIGFIYNGNNIDRTYAIRTKEQRQCDFTMVVNNLDTSTYRLVIFTYSSAGVYETFENYNNSSYEIVLDPTKRYRFAISLKSGEGNIDLETALKTVMLFNKSKTWNEFEKIADYENGIANVEQKILDSRRDLDYKKQAIKYGYNKRIDDVWEIGHLYNGNNLDRTYAIRTHSPKAYPAKAKIINNLGNAVSIVFWKYNSDGTYDSASSGYRNSEFTYEFDADYLYRITISQESGDIDLNNTLDNILFMDYSDTKEYDGYNVSFRFGYPQFYHSSSIHTKVIFPKDAVMLVASPKRTIRKQYTFTTAEEYELSNNDYLIYDIDNNTIELSQEGIETVNTLVLASFRYNTIEWCHLLPYFVLWCEKSEKNDFLPYYYAEYMKGKISEIRTAFRTIGADGDAFGFVTDTHWTVNCQKSPSILKVISENTQLNKVFHGGDIVPAYGTEETMYSAAYDEITAFGQEIGDILYRIAGNHDFHITDNSTSQYYELTASETYGMMFMKQECKVQPNKEDLEGMYFYFDNEAHNIRYIFVNNFEEPNVPYMSVEQQEWIKSKLLEVNDDWTVVVIGHAPIIQSQNDDYQAYTNFVSLLERFANHTDDFVGGTSNLVGYISGHMHQDMFEKVNNVNYIVTTCDTLYQTDGYNRQANTVYEQAIDIFFINTANKTLKTVRLGAGSNRSFTY